VGEQPIKGLLNPAAMARLTLGESLTNLVWARVSSLNDVKASGNWMYASKLPGEGADLYDACVTLRDTMIALGVAIDGGKDSLSMAAAAGGETVKAPGELVVSLYCTCPDITLTVTPNLKLPDGVLLHVDLAAGKRRLGGSALAHAYGQIGDETPDMDDVAMFKRAFEVTQTLVGERKIASGHDISDGGLITALLEMAFAGNCGVSAALPAPAKGGALAALFAEELGLLLEVSPAAEAAVVAAYSAAGVPVSRLGRVAAAGAVDVTVGGQPAISGHVAQLRDAWETTAFKLERLQSSAATVAQEEAGLASRRAPTWHLPYAVVPTPVLASRHRVAVLREEGTNGDREMAAAVQAAGFEPWDVTMSDLLEKRIALDAFRGIIFAGGFSYADVLDSAKGWAGAIKFNPELTAQFNAFYARQDTFSLGVCNGCQLMALLGWVPGTGVDAAPLLESGAQPRFVRNASGRFESRFVTVRVLPDSPAIMLQGMEGLQMGVWSAHGEGRVLFPDSGVQGRIMRDALAPIRYVDDDGAPTDVYPFNPNGSADGIAALCSPDGRHLAMMPHPERAFLNWQLPWVPPAHEAALPLASHSPWLKLFQNARVWCDSKK
jgi:phosphoribosylformylglycinamidine synthase